MYYGLEDAMDACYCLEQCHRLCECCPSEFLAAIWISKLSIQAYTADFLMLDLVFVMSLITGP
jgi:hypothetical protein